MFRLGQPNWSCLPLRRVPVKHSGTAKKNESVNWVTTSERRSEHLISLTSSRLWDNPRCNGSMGTETECCHPGHSLVQKSQWESRKMRQIFLREGDIRQKRHPWPVTPQKSTTVAHGNKCTEGHSSVMFLLSTVPKVTMWWLYFWLFVLWLLGASCFATKLEPPHFILLCRLTSLPEGRGQEDILRKTSCVNFITGHCLLLLISSCA